MRTGVDKLYELLESLEAESRSFGIPSISREDGTLLAGLAFSSCSEREGLLVDAGAGIGYSTAWLVLGALGSGRECRVVAIEYSSRLYRYLRKTAEMLSRFMEVEAINDNALRVLGELDDVRVLFVDVEKHQYPEALSIGASITSGGGYMAFHNAFFPRPPEEFFKAMEKLGWPSIAIPTLAGGMMIIRRPAGR